MSGPRSLRDLVGAWQPGGMRSPSGEAASLVATWPDIVGAEVARRTRPLHFRDGMLSILTMSSEWSHHLSFLAPAILERLRAHTPQLDVRRLRFAVATGRTRALLTGSSGNSVAAALARPAARSVAAALAQPMQGRSVQDPPAAENLDELLAHLRRDQVALDRARTAAGWPRCAGCGSFYEPGAGDAEQCALCIAQRRQGRNDRIARVLLHDPWMQWADLSAHAPDADERVYERVRRRLLSTWEQHLGHAQPRLRRRALEAGDRVAAWSYMMMLTRKPQRDIRRAAVENALGREWAEALLEARQTTPKNSM